MIDSLELAAAVLLAGAGATKIAAPGPAAATLVRLWPRLRPVRSLGPIVRAGGTAEVAIGAAVFALGGRIAALLLVGCYAAFAAASLLLVRRGQRAPCGCFGHADAPIGFAHVVLTTVCAVVGIAAAIRPIGTVGGLFHGSALRGAAGLGQVALLAYLGFLSITALPALAGARRQLLES